MRRAAYVIFGGVIFGCLFIAGVTSLPPRPAVHAAERPAGGQKKPSRDLDAELWNVLDHHGFSGNIEKSLEGRLGRKLDQNLADLGRDLFFDPIGSLRGDNSCAGCHAPQFGFGDSQSIAIGIFNNGVVGPGRMGPRNQRRSPMLMNTAFYPALMWNGRFFANSGDPFDNSEGFTFPFPEGTTRFPPGDKRFPHLLVAQAHIPPTELTEVTGFRDTAGTVDPVFDQFDDGRGIPVPPPDGDGNRNEPIRERVLAELNKNKEYVRRFGRQFRSVRQGEPITFAEFGAAIAEFEFTLTRADAPLDRFARGQRNAMTDAEKRGALVFFGKGGCVECHAVAGPANEMFSDFANHNIGVPQVAPVFGFGTGDVIFDGPNSDEDFGAAQLNGNVPDRYKFRTSPLRNVALQPSFFHNGAFTRLSDAIAHHLNVEASVQSYSTALAGVAPDLHYRPDTMPGVLATLDAKVAHPTALTPSELADLVEFVSVSLLDERASPKQLNKLIPRQLPSKQSLPHFE